MPEAYEHNAAYHSTKPYIVRVNQAVQDFIAFALANYERTPDGFDISSEGWHKMEHDLSEAIADHNEVRAIALAKEYEQRATAYLNKWREIITKKEAA